MKRILLKISGEAFCGAGEKGIQPEALQNISDMIELLLEAGKELVVVVGWGNIYRWSSLIIAGVDPVDSHNLSMLSTIFNAVTLKNFLTQRHIDAVVLDALHVEFVEAYRAIQAQKYLQEGKVVICSSGTWTPFFTTDTGGVVKALELGCDVMLKATKVDGIYSQDPKKFPDAERYEHISYNDFVRQNLQVLDQSAVILARDNGLKLHVLRFEKESLSQFLKGEKVGSSIF